jgi:hypothetical protein
VRPGGRRAKKTDCRGDGDRGEKKASSFQDGLAGSVGREGSGVKQWLRRRFRLYKSKAVGTQARRACGNGFEACPSDGVVESCAPN